FTETRPGAHSYLPDAAMALIAQYQRNPVLASGQPAPGDSGGDATSASYTELPASYQPKKSPPRPPRTASRPAGWRHWVRTHLAWVGWVSVGAALIVTGVILGASLSSSGSPGGAISPAPRAVAGPVQVGPGPGLCMGKQSRGVADATFAVQGNHF